MNGKHQLTAEGLEAYKQELERLQTVERARVVEALKEARAQGDLSENAEYDAARDEQARLESRIKELENIIKNAVVIDSDKKTNNMGKKICIKFDDGFVETYTLLGSLEADPLNGIISNESPIGKAVINCKIGDKVLVKAETGDEFYVEILNIE